MSPLFTFAIIQCWCFHYYVQAGSYRQDERNYGWRMYGPRRKESSRKPNIVFVLTDDQDAELGSMNYMPKTLKYLAGDGATFNNAYVTTPMCCPSRSSILTGLYTHNHNTYTNNDNCSSIAWQQTHETRTFATYLSNVGYRTGYFGKYLNEYNGTYIPPGWREWVGLIRNSRYYNYTINFNGKKIKHDWDYHRDYFPDLIANDSVAFLKLSKQYFPNKPVMMVLSMPSPHGPEDAAPQYQHLFPNVTFYKTPSYDFAPNPDKQWILQNVGKLEPIHHEFIKILYQKRLQTLQSVDDAVEKVIGELKALGELDNTYIIYSSDHGYHLGQYGLVKGKSMPYEFDVKVPLYIRGPGIPKGVKLSNIVLNVDLAPTILDMAGVAIPKHMDGESILKLFQEGVEETNIIDGTLQPLAPWRDTFLLSRGKVTHKMLKRLARLEGKEEFSKEAKLARECAKPEFRAPCDYNKKQLWVCKINEEERWRKYKCRYSTIYKGECVCKNKSSLGKDTKVDRRERTKQRAFIENYVGKEFRPKFIKPPKNSQRQSRAVSRKSKPNRKAHRDLDTSDEIIGWEPPTESWSNFYSDCKYSNNGTIDCYPPVYRDMSSWKVQKQAVDYHIRIYKEQLDKLKELRQQLKEHRPATNNPYPEDGEICTCEDEIDYANSSISVQDLGDATFSGVFGEDSNSAQTWLKRSDGRKKLKKDHRKAMLSKAKLEEREMRRREKMERREANLQRKLKRQSRKQRNMALCNEKSMNCFSHDNNHWRTYPYWIYGPFCVCQQSNNNTYWCVRTINETHNFLYCEFITGFISFYNLTEDPYQLHNAVTGVSDDLLQSMHEMLNRLRKCSGAQQCTVDSRPKKAKGQKEKFQPLWKRKSKLLSRDRSNRDKRVDREQRKKEQRRLRRLRGRSL